ncbi:MFS transporter [Streptomyces sp. TRM 70351]|uniref:MFS transporter n=1 Tax=Streptomyces sp. TRM 70351 TaxID=3116552 RepID=UPI002E7BCCA7|nr:MFS transporter [Streptomyces sp. TRM 70351]MEE1930441.1 MFS transporter [Streptomyces sp. TRM 70351]
MALPTFRRSGRTVPPPASAGGIGGRDFLLLLAATLGTFSNYAPLLSVVPAWSAQGGTALGGVGAATGVTMATTVGVQLFMAGLLRRFGLRRLLAAGAALLGLPTFAYVLSPDLGWVLAVSAVRGVGFGMVAVAGSALVAELVPAGQRGRAVGWYGVAVGLPQVVCLPLGVWIAAHVGFAPVFVATGLLSLLAVPLAVALRTPAAPAPAHPSDAPDTPGAPDTSGAARRRRTAGRLRPLAAPWAMLIASACALGGVTSFLPLGDSGASVASTALFVLSAAIIAGRWGAGVWSDRFGTGRLLLPSLLACVLGVAGFALSSGSSGYAAALAVAAAAVYGTGFGVLQNDTLVVMFQRAGPRGNGMASTAWNMAYDAGTGVGAVAVGLLARPLGIGGGYLACAALIALTLPLTRRPAGRERPREHPAVPSAAGRT